MAQPLQLTLLGRPEIQLADAPLAIVSAKARALLFYLAMREGSHSRQRLAALLWGELSEGAARTNLRGELSTLRRAVGDHLAISRTTIGFDHSAPHWIDAALLAEWGSAPDDSAATLERAVALYRDEFLSDFEVRDAPDFDQWVISERERLQRVVEGALARLVRYYEGDEPELALEHTHRLLELIPWREESHRDAMRLQARLGRRAAALEQFERCRAILEEELAVEPDPATLALRDRIARGEIDRAAVAAPAPVPAEPTAASRLDSLPRPSTRFVGRDEELERATGRLLDPAVRLLTITGTGGMGKTRFAIEVAQRMLDHEDSPFEQGVCFVPLDPVDSPDTLISALAGALDLTFFRGESPRDQLLRTLAPQRLLLVLDNIEHLLPDTSLFADILAAAPGVTMLATSRARLNLSAEYVIELAGLPLEEVPRGSAVELFEQSADRVLGRGTLGAENRPHVLRICRLVDGLPLAIELAAAWASLLSCEEIADEIEQGFDFLASPWHDLPARHRSLRAVFDYSWQLLTAAEREVYARLTHFRGGFTREAAREVAGASLVLLRRLLDQSFLFREPGGRFNMHPVLREFAAERLDHDDPVLERHARYFAYFCERRAAALHSPEQREILEQLESEIDNIRRAWGWAVAAGQLELVDQLLDGLYQLLAIRGLIDEVEELLEAATLRARELELEEPTRARTLEGRLLARRAATMAERGHHDRAHELLERALEIARGPFGSERELAFALIQLSRVLVGLGEYEESEQAAVEAHTLYARLGDPYGLGSALKRQGFVALTATRYRDALARFERARELMATTGSALDEGLILIGQGTCYNSLQDYDEHERCTREALAIFERIGYRQGQAGALNNLADRYLDLGDYPRARETLEAALDRFEAIGDLGGASLVRINLGALHERTGDAERSHELLAHATADLSRVGERAFFGYAKHFLGHALAALDRPDEARSAYQEALEIRGELGQDTLILETRAGLAALELDQGERARALEQITPVVDALEEGTPVGAEEPFRLYLIAYRVLDAQDGEEFEQRARELLLLAYRLLQERAARFKNPAHGALYLEQVAAHRAIAEEASRLADHGNPHGGPGLRGPGLRSAPPGANRAESGREETT